MGPPRIIGRPSIESSAAGADGKNGRHWGARIGNHKDDSRANARQSDKPFFSAAALRACAASSLSAFFISFSSIVILPILPVNLNGTL